MIGFGRPRRVAGGDEPLRVRVGEEKVQDVVQRPARIMQDRGGDGGEAQKGGGNGSVEQVQRRPLLQEFSGISGRFLAFASGISAS